MSLSPEFLQRTDELYQSFHAFDASQDNRLNRYRNIEPDSAYFLAMQIRMQQSKSILEIGTSTGYSTLWLANAAQSTHGHITTLEIDANRSQTAKQYATELNLAHLVDFWVGDAKTFLQTTQTQYDFILLDAERDAYLDYWVYLQNMIKPKGGVLFVDNVLSHAQDVALFIEAIQQDSRFMLSTIHFGAGLLMVTYQ